MGAGNKSPQSFKQGPSASQIGGRSQRDAVRVGFAASSPTELSSGQGRWKWVPQFDFLLARICMPSIRSFGRPPFTSKEERADTSAKGAELKAEEFAAAAEGKHLPPE
jgi:hypothetical protein